MRLLLDAHLPPELARQLRRRGVDAVHLRDWMGSDLLDASDDRILSIARSDRRVLVTYDCRTIPPLIVGWAEAGRSHAGVILVDERTCRPNDIGGLMRALLRLAETAGEGRWGDRVVFLQPG